MRNVIIVAYGVIVVVVASVAGMLGVMRYESGVAGPTQVITTQPRVENPYQQLYEQMLYPTVRITTAEGIGSGVVIAPWVVRNASGIQAQDAERTTQDAYILTAAHVVGTYSSVTVTFYSYRRGAEVAEELQASVLITDTNKDLGLLRVLGVSAVKSAKLAPRDYVPYLFTPVWTVGCSLGLSPRPSSGYITAVSSEERVAGSEGNPHSSLLTTRYWEVSAPILPGNSGGPVYDAKTYQVIGIAVWVKVYNGQLVTTMVGIVPIQTVYEFLESIELPNSKNSMNPTNFYPLSRYPEVSKTAASA